MPKRLKISEFISIAKHVHGNKYNYSNTNYINSHTNVVITCPIHGNFSQLPNNHINKKGCPECGQIQSKIKLTSTTQEFISGANKVHNQIYDYSTVNYVGNKNKVDIICKIHGIFKQTPDAHLSGKGCEKCYYDNRRMTTEEFIKVASEIHKNQYDYSEVLYGNNTLTKVTIICPKHGKFLQSPNKHLTGRGCPNCGHSISKSEKQFLDYIKIPNDQTHRQVIILKKKVDGYDPTTNTIYEFLGDYWHGNPDVFDHNNIHPDIKITFGQLYNKTILRLQHLKSLGYIVKYIWEKDWHNFVKTPKITLKLQIL